MKMKWQEEESWRISGNKMKEDKWGEELQEQVKVGEGDGAGNELEEEEGGKMKRSHIFWRLWPKKLKHQNVNIYRAPQN